jgi:hypothetical protein
MFHIYFSSLPLFSLIISPYFFFYFLLHPHDVPSHEHPGPHYVNNKMKKKERKKEKKKERKKKERKKEK